MIQENSMVSDELASGSGRAWRRFVLRDTRLAASVFALILLALFGESTLGAVSVTPTDPSVAKANSYDDLRERVRSEPLTNLTDKDFPEQLIIGRRYGGDLWVSSFLHDPDNPNTLEHHFADWNLAARASLFLSYARLMTKPAATSAAGRPDEQIRSIRTKEEARIAHIASAGGYATSWRPFVLAYRKLLQSAETLLPPGDTAQGDMQTTLGIIARLAREQGMYRLVRELPVDPADVANEMLRLVDDWRAPDGSSTETTDQEPSLLYLCDSTVRVHPWHRLAPAFFQAWEATDKKRDDPQARQIMKVFDEICREMKAWAVAHPYADWSNQESALKHVAKVRGLYSLLEREGRQ